MPALLELAKQGLAFLKAIKTSEAVLIEGVVQSIVVLESVRPCHVAIAQSL